MNQKNGGSKISEKFYLHSANIWRNAKRAALLSKSNCSFKAFSSLIINEFDKMICNGHYKSDWVVAIEDLNRVWKLNQNGSWRITTTDDRLFTLIFVAMWWTFGKKGPNRWKIPSHEKNIQTINEFMICSSAHHIPCKITRDTLGQFPETLLAIECMLIRIDDIHSLPPLMAWLGSA